MCIVKSTKDGIKITKSNSSKENKVISWRERERERERDELQIHST
jgi:hypothetical protein